MKQRILRWQQIKRKVGFAEALEPNSRRKSKSKPLIKRFFEYNYESDSGSNPPIVKLLGYLREHNFLFEVKTLIKRGCQHKSFGFVLLDPS